MTTRLPHRPTGCGAAFLVAAALVAGGCSAQTGGTPEPTTGAAADPATTTTGTTTTTGEAASSAASDNGRLPGYDEGLFPAVPLFTLPDLGLVEAALTGFTPTLSAMVGDYPGLTIAPARCDTTGEVVAGPGSMLLYGDGSGIYTGPDGRIVNYGDGSGSYTVGGVEVITYGDGSGSYDGNGLRINNYGDGSGNYADGRRTVNVYGDGSGNWETADERIDNYGDGAGRYSGPDYSITNYGDGSGNYVSATLTINNYGDGTGTINDVRVSGLDRIDPIPPIGTFPPMGALEPIASCGTTVTLDSAVLFDFDKWEIRPDADEALDSLARAMSDGAVPTAEVLGHTDSVGGDDWNQTLSDRRAAAAVEALTQRGVTTALTATGYGESRPTATNDTDAGRQLNRRVEVFLPNF